ncbi:hypothetical protein B0H13DRAFT_1855560 [Mycena leptocephala]|nr:hypothetical protein B0H13DRAFT_1855560 [Mycena leptocephala]
MPSLMAPIVAVARSPTVPAVLENSGISFRMVPAVNAGLIPARTRLCWSPVSCMRKKRHNKKFNDPPWRVVRLPVWWMKMSKLSRLGPLLEEGLPRMYRRAHGSEMTSRSLYTRMNIRFLLGMSLYGSGEPLEASPYIHDRADGRGICLIVHDRRKRTTT